VAERTRAEELYDLHRDKVWEDIKSGTESFDKYMLTFSSGALALSLAFIKDVVPLGRAVWITSLIGSWIAFVLCILVTLMSFQFSIKALESTIPALNEYYLQRKEDAFNRHLQSFWSRAVGWCTLGQAISFALGVIFTMMFVIVNVREDRMSKPDNTQKVVTGALRKSPLQPAAMTPLSEGFKPSQMTPTVVNGEHRGVQSVPMTPTPTQTPVQPASGNTPAQPTQSSKE
jgi:hypothetical protein